MHMANELLSAPVAGGTIVAAVVGLGLICKKASKLIDNQTFAMMGIMGAFVFAAQMVNFPLVVLPGTSGHLVGAVLLAIVLGPWLGAIVISSVVIIQCLIFQDGGILALGCNLINMAIVPSFLGYYIYRLISGKNPNPPRLYIACITAGIISLFAGSILVTLQAAVSGVVTVPLNVFLFTMAGVHLIIGFVEGVITAAVLAYIRQVRPDCLKDYSCDKYKLSHSVLYISLFAATLLIAGGLSLFASDKPDGLEWSYLERPDQPQFKTYVENNSDKIEAVDVFQARFSLLPDYGLRSSALGKVPDDEAQTSTGWASMIAVCGSLVTMFFIWLTGFLLRKKTLHASCTN